MIQRKYSGNETVDFVIVGSGAAGGVLAKELATSGFDVIVLEQGPWQQAAQFTHDELAIEREGAMLNTAFEPFQSFRTTDADAAKRNTGRALLYRRGVGGSSVHFAANFWRFRPIDFKERSVVGSISGTGFADWPITYEELEPYYTKVDWEIGVSGAPGPFDPPRSRAYPMPPLPNKSSGVLLERARARARPARAGRTNGDPLGAVRRPPAMHGVRALRVLWVRVRSEVVDAGDHDPESRRDWPMRDPNRIHRVPNRDERARACDGRGVLGPRGQGTPANRAGGGPRGERRRDDTAVAVVRVSGVSARSRELERQRRPLHHVQRPRGIVRPIRASAQRVQGCRRQPNRTRLL